MAAINLQLDYYYNKYKDLLVQEIKRKDGTIVSTKITKKIFVTRVQGMMDAKGIKLSEAVTKFLRSSSLRGAKSRIMVENISSVISRSQELKLKALIFISESGYMMAEFLEEWEKSQDLRDFVMGDIEIDWGRFEYQSGDQKLHYGEDVDGEEITLQLIPGADSTQPDWVKISPEIIL